MIFGDEFEFVNELSQPSFPLSDAEKQQWSDLGLIAEDIEALARAYTLCTDKELRQYLLLAMVHYRNQRVRILSGLHYCLDEIVGRSYPLTVGADSIFGKARCDIEGFEISNIFRPFYARILAAQRPDDAARITINDSWADYLRLARWPPITSGKDS